MPKYLLSWNEIDTLNIVIEADSKKKALDKFYANDYDNEDVENVSVTFDEDSLELEEV
jgi:hypothetical protein